MLEVALQVLDDWYKHYVGLSPEEQKVLDKLVDMVALGVLTPKMIMRALNANLQMIEFRHLRGLELMLEASRAKPEEWREVILSIKEPTTLFGDDMIRDVLYHVAIGCMTASMRLRHS